MACRSPAPRSPMAIQSGALAGYANLRDNVAPQYQAPARPDRRRPDQRLRRKRPDRRRRRADAARPLHLRRRDRRALDRGDHGPCQRDRSQRRTSIPRRAATSTLLRDGGIADPSNPAYTYNTTGAASYTGRIQQLMSALTTTHPSTGSTGWRLRTASPTTPMPR